VIEEGQTAPDFELASDSGESVWLSGLRGSPSPRILEGALGGSAVRRSPRSGPRARPASTIGGNGRPAPRSWRAVVVWLLGRKPW